MSKQKPIEQVEPIKKVSKGPVSCRRLASSAKFGDNNRMIIIDLPGRDRIEAHLDQDGWKISVVGCVALTREIQNRMRAQPDPTRWELPVGVGHEDLLIRELILRAKGEWNFPYVEAEVCHCRSVETAIVDQAILAGAHSCKQVSSQTNASTSCGTCRSDVKKIIDYRLGLKA